MKINLIIKLFLVGILFTTSATLLGKTPIQPITELNKQQLDSLSTSAEQLYLEGKYKDLVIILETLRDHFRTSNNRERLLEINLRMADVHRALKNFEIALSICNDQLLEVKGDQVLESKIYQLKGSIYYELREPYNAIKELDKALEIFEEFKMTEEKGNALITKGAIYQNLGNDSTRIILNEAISILKSVGDEAGVSLAYYNMGNSFSSSDSMIKYFNLSLEIARQLNITTYQIMSLHGLVLAYEDKKMWKEAFTAVGERDALEQRNTSQRALAEANQLLEQIEEETDQERLIALQETLKLNAELDTRKNLFLILLLAVMILLIIFLGIIYRNNHRRKIDLLELEKLNKEVSDYSSKLVELNETKDSILSIISHDLRSPFSQLITFLAFAAEDDLTPEDMNMINKEMLVTSKNGLHMLDNLLYWANSQREGQNRVKSEFTAASVVQDVKEQLNYLAKNKSVKVKIHCPLTLSMEADKILYEIVVRNVMSNAIKFSESEGQVDVTVEKSGKRIDTIVRDYGVGIPESIVDSLNSKKLDYKSLPGTKGEKGAGMGLYLSQEFAKQNAGSLFFERLKDGTKVTFSIKSS